MWGVGFGANLAQEVEGCLRMPDRQDHLCQVMRLRAQGSGLWVLGLSKDHL